MTKNVSCPAILPKSRALKLRNRYLSSDQITRTNLRHSPMRKAIAKLNFVRGLLNVVLTAAVKPMRMRHAGKAHGRRSYRSADQRTRATLIAEIHVTEVQEVSRDAARRRDPGHDPVRRAIPIPVPTRCRSASDQNIRKLREPDTKFGRPPDDWESLISWTLVT